MRIRKNTKGITLISLVITIIILIILASVATYSGIQVVNSSKLTAFTTELKIMQTQVNKLYDERTNDEETIDGLGKEISTVQTQADKVFAAIADEIDNNEGYRYYDKETIKNLGIEGVEGEFFVNVQKRSVVSYEGLKYEGNTYYTLNQLPDNSLYNVEYKENNTWNSEIDSFDVSYTELDQGKYRITVSDIDYKSGNINNWQLKYKKEGEDNWKQTDSYSFIIDETANYRMKLVNNNIESNEKQIIYKTLPSQYQQVEYLESTGTQYIDTGIKGNNDNLSFDIKYSWTVLPNSNSYQYILGSYIGENYNCMRILQYGNDITYYNINTKAGGGTTVYNSSRLANVIYEETFTPNLLTINSFSQEVSNNTKGIENNSNIFLYRCRRK